MVNTPAAKGARGRIEMKFEKERIDITDMPAAKLIDMIDRIEKVKHRNGRRIAVMKEVEG